MLNTKPWRLAVLAAVAGLYGCDSGPEIVPASWASQPSAADLARAYPAFARMAPLVFVIAFNPPSAPPVSSAAPATGAEMAALRRGVSLTGAMERQMAQFQASRSVELDRMSAVAAIVERAHDAESEDRVDTVLRGVIQAMTPAQRQELATNPRYMVLPNRLEIEAASPEYFAYTQRLATRMRTEYCAAYSCDATLPNAEPASR